MADASVLVGGILIRTNKVINQLYNHRSGFLVKFTLRGITYIHVSKVNFRNEDQNTKFAKGGYYEETSFLKYRAKEVLAEEIFKFKLKPEKIEKGQINDKINVRKLKIKSPYMEFCKVDDISWIYTGGDILDNNFEINIPKAPISKVVTTDIPVHQVAREFYEKNIIITNSLPLEQKETGAYQMAMIALQIDRIQRDIFPLFSNELTFNDYISSQNLEWSQGELFVDPTIKKIAEYLGDITGFYNALYANQIAIKKAVPNRKLYWLAFALSARALKILPVADKVNILNLMAQGVIGETRIFIDLFILSPIGNSIIAPTFSEEHVALKIVESVLLVPNQHDEFLQKLVSLYDGVLGKTSLFEILYGNIDDNRMSRYSFGLINQRDNRKALIKLLFGIWKASQYNPYYESPAYTQPKNKNGVYPESFFMTEQGKAFYNSEKAPAVFEYINSETQFETFVQTFDFNIKGYKIDAEIITSKEIVDDEGNFDVRTESKFKAYGTYHLLQPISVIGYKPDIDVSMPEENCIPIFYLYYANDYKEIKEFDFGVMLFVELALNFTGLGELQYLKYLGHLKNLSKIGRLSELTATELVLVWKAVNGVNTAMQFTAGSALAISNYLHNTSDDQDIINFTGKLNIFLGLLTLGSLSVNAVIKRRVITAAKNVIIDKNYLLSLGKDPNLPQQVINEIELLANIDELIALIRTKIENLQLSSSNTILEKFDEMVLHQDKFDFFANFYHLDDTDEAWGLLNKEFLIGGGPQKRTLVDIWRSEIKVRREVRGNLKFLTSYNYMIYIEKDIWEHLNLIKNSPKYGGTGFNPIGGHTSDNFVKITSLSDLNNPNIVNKYLIFDPNIPGLPINMQVYKEVPILNGHIDHENLFIWNQSGSPSGGAVHVIGNKVFKPIKLKTQINPSWSIDKIKEEYVFANFNKTLIETKNTQVSKFGQINPQIIKKYEGVFSDGTIVKIHVTNYDWQNGQLYRNYVSYMEIKK